MSKFSKALEQTFTGEKKIVPQRYKIKFESDKTYSYGIGKQVRLGAMFVAQGYVEDNPSAKIDTSAEVVNSLRRALIEELFGEFRPYFIEMHTAMYEYDFDRMRTLLAQMEHQMFVE